MSRTTPDLNDIIVRAGAGAGKTTDLVRRVLEMEEHFLSAHQRHAKIVVTTFTRKATQELKERLLAKALQSGQSEWIEFVQRSSQLHISTIHGVISIFLTRYGSALGLNPQFEILSQAASLKRAKKIFREKLQESPEFAVRSAKILEFVELKNLLKVFLQYELDKTTGRQKRIRQTDLQELREQKLDLMNSMAGELISSIQGEDLPDSWTLYLQELQKLTQSKKLTLEQVKNFLNSVKSPVKSKKVSDELGLQKNIFQDGMKDFLSFGFSDDFIEMHESLSLDFEFCANLWSTTLAEEKLLTGQLSLADLELLALRLIQEAPHTAALFSQEWDYWMVDEYQDTSPLQVQLLRSLIGERKCFTVGDPQQSIYLFRGARSEVFLEKEELVQKQGGQRLTLMKNYRSRPELLNFFNDIFTHLNPQQFRPMEIGFHKDLVCVEADPVRLIVAENREMEVQKTLERVSELLSLGVRHEKICVLSRGNKELDLLASEAKKWGLPVQVHSSSQFADRQEVRDAVALLRFLVNPADNQSFLHLLRSPFHFVEDQILQELLPSSSKIGAHHESYFNKALQKKWSEALKLQSLLDRCKAIGFIAGWKEGLRQARYFDLLKCMDPSGRKEANIWKLVSLLAQAEKMPGFSILDFIEEMSATQVDADGDQDATPVIEPAKVNLMTVHASKGLQFEYVIVPFLGKRPPSPTAQFWMADDQGWWTLCLPEPEEGRLCRSQFAEMLLETKKQREEQELERVFYVALTRAELGVTLLWSSTEKGSLASKILPLKCVSDLPHYLPVNTSMTYETGDMTTSHPPRLVFSELEFKKTDRISVTSIVNAIQDSGASSVVPVAARSAEISLASLSKAMLGVEVHRLFEAIKYSDDFKSGDTKFVSAYEYLRAQKEPNLIQLIRQGEVEWGFAIQLKNQILQGQVDLWGQDSKGDFLVVDYKTGSESHFEKALHQLEIYSWALRKIGKIPRNHQPELLIVYPFSGKTIKRKAAKFETIDQQIQAIE